MNAPAVPLPAFQSPPAPATDPYDPTTDDQPPAPAPSSPPSDPPPRNGRQRRSPFGQLNPRRETPADDTPTDTSSGGDDRGRSDLVNRETTTRLVIGLIGVAVAGAAWAVQARDKRRKLRRPTKQESRDIARPLAKLMLRIADTAVLNPILVDAIETLAATGAYVSAGPLTTFDGMDAGVPPDLQEAPE